MTKFVIMMFLLMTLAAMIASPQTTVQDPNFLEPIPVYSPDDYYQTVYRALIGDVTGMLWVVSMPGFPNEYSLVLRCTDQNSGENNDSKGVMRKECCIEFSMASESIWHWKEMPSGYTGQMHLDLRKNVKVERKSCNIDAALADEIQKAWRAVLMRTKYASNYWRGFDGDTYHFYCHPNYFGETWSPEIGLPAMLVDLALQLRKAVENEGPQRSKILVECSRKAKKIAAEAAQEN